MENILTAESPSGTYFFLNFVLKEALLMAPINDRVSEFFLEKIICFTCQTLLIRLASKKKGIVNFGTC